jgi:hypothetical protein
MAATAQLATYVIRLFVGAIEDHMGRRSQPVLEAALEFSSLQVVRASPDLSR